MTHARVFLLIGMMAVLAGNGHAAALAALEHAASGTGGGAATFDGAQSRPGVFTLVPSKAASAPKMVEKKTISFKASGILADTPSASAHIDTNPGYTLTSQASLAKNASDGSSTVGEYTTVVGGLMAMGGMAYFPVLGVGLVLLALGWLF